MPDPTTPDLPAKPKKKRPVKSSTRAMIEARRRGWTPGVVERRLPRGFTTVDLFGFIDIVAMDDKDGVVAIQACGATDVTPHLMKMTHDPEVAPLVAKWLARDNRLVLWSFRKLKVKRGGVAVRWAVREIRAALENGAVIWKEPTEDALPEETAA